MSGRKPRGRPRGSGRRNQSTTFDSLVQLDETPAGAQTSSAEINLRQVVSKNETVASESATEAAPTAFPHQPSTAQSQLSSARTNQTTSLESPDQAASRVASSPRGRRQLTRQPVNPGRRSKEARDALAQEAFEREKEKRQEQANEALRAERAKERLLRGRGRGDRARGRGRGGFMGDSHSVSGPFSGGKITHDHRPRGPRSDPSSHNMSKSGSSYTKKDPLIKRETSQLAALSGNDVKKEVHDGGYISSDPDEEVEGPVWNVDDPIQVISDDEKSKDNTSSSLAKHNTPRTISGLIPIIVARKEHKDRIIGINTEASSASAAELRRRQAESKGGASIEEAMLSAVKKGKARVKDVEVVSSTRFKGMWQDDEESSGKAVKEEPGDADIDDAIAEFDNIGEAAGSSAPRRAEAKSPSQHEQGKKRLNKGKIRRQSSSLLEPPSNLQTEEEKEEWQRQQLALATLRDELGSIDITGSRDEDVAIANAEDQPRDQKADRVYLFQFPPVLPDLSPVVPKIKTEQSMSTSQPEESIFVSANSDPSIQQQTSQAAATIAKSTAKNPIKIEDNKKVSHPFPALGDSSQMPRLSSGRAGKLRVHASGRATLSWGGTSLELHMGIPANFLQDVAVLQMPRTEKPAPDGTAAEETKNGEEEETGLEEGVALGLGQVRGKFVVTPDWEEIVG